MKCIGSYQAYVVEGDYRKYVGPRWSYDKEGAWQFMVMCLLGLREYHNFLEIAAGSLRAARLFIPYLRPGHYCGVEAQEQMVKLGIQNEVGEDQIRIKKPTFLYNDRFAFQQLNRTFDYILAHRILCHLCGTDISLLIHNAASVLEEDGLLVANYNVGEGDESKASVEYGTVTHVREDTVKRAVESAGLAYIALPFNDRRVDERWFLAVKPHIYTVVADSAVGYMMRYWIGVNEAMGHTDA